jgi:hypothetical protein
VAAPAWLCADGSLYPSRAITHGPILLPIRWAIRARRILADHKVLRIWGVGLLIPSVTAEPTADGYVIPLSYGEDVDWLKNVRASGRGTIEARDGTHVVGEPKVIDAEEAMAAVSARARLMYRAFGVERYLKMKRLAEEESARAGIVHQGLPGRSEGACRLARLMSQQGQG